MPAMTDKPSLILNNGVVYEDSQCGYADHNLWCWIKGSSLNEVFAAFSDPENTKVIRFLYGDTEETYTGFTEIVLIRKSEFTVDVRLVRKTGDQDGVV